MRDILVHMDGTEQNKVRVEAAAQLAQWYDAHLTGLFVLADPFIPIYDAAQLPPEFYEEQETLDRQQAEAAENMFRGIAGPTGVSTEWRVDQGTKADVVARHAHYCDLVIAGQRNPEQPAGGDVPDGLLLSIGRPILILPYVSQSADIGKRIMVAWNASPQATRAVHDAIPFMSQAGHVDVIAVNPDGSHGEIPCADISLHLARHGIKCEAQSITVNDIGVADMLLSRAADQSADMIVMGAYGHARWREWVFGGVTAHMLGHMTIPVLMAH